MPPADANKWLNAFVFCYAAIETGPQSGRETIGICAMNTRPVLFGMVIGAIPVVNQLRLRFKQPLIVAGVAQFKGIARFNRPLPQSAIVAFRRQTLAFYCVLNQPC